MPQDHTALFKTVAYKNAASKQRLKAGVLSLFTGLPVTRVEGTAVDPVAAAEAASSLVTALAKLREPIAAVQEAKAAGRLADKGARDALTLEMLKGLFEVAKTTISSAGSVEAQKAAGLLDIQLKGMEEVSRLRSGEMDKATLEMFAEKAPAVASSLRTAYTKGGSIADQDLEAVVQMLAGVPQQSAAQRIALLRSLDEQAGLPRDTLFQALTNPESLGDAERALFGPAFDRDRYRSAQILALDGYERRVAEKEQIKELERDYIESGARALRTGIGSRTQAAALGPVLEFAEAYLSQGELSPEQLEDASDVAVDLATEVPMADEATEAAVQKRLAALDPEVPLTPRQMEQAILDSPEFAAYMEDKGLQDPQTARKLLRKETRQWEKARRKQDRATIASGAIAKGAPTPAETQQALTQARAPAKPPTPKTLAVAGAEPPAMGEVTRRPEAQDFAAERRRKASENIASALKARTEFEMAKPRGMLGQPPKQQE